jgi:hypothetical protein
VDDQNNNDEENSAEAVDDDQPAVVSSEEDREIEWKVTWCLESFINAETWWVLSGPTQISNLHTPGWAHRLFKLLWLYEL